MTTALASCGASGTAPIDLAGADALARRSRLLDLVNAAWTTQAIAAAVELCIADYLADLPCSAEALAKAASCDVYALRRLLCALATLDIVVQRDDDSFALTATGELLRADVSDSVAAWALLCGRRIWDNWRQLTESVRTGQSAKKRSGGSDDFTHLADDRRGAELFHRAMMSLTHAVATAAAARIDFSGVARLVDIGGGNGYLLSCILAAHPAMRGVLFDLEHAVADADGALTRAGVLDRCEIVAGNFFESVPGGADAYLLKSVLHDWDDVHCAAILHQCRAAMLRGAGRPAQLLVIERIAPARFSANVRDQAIARSDLNMLVSLGGRERSETGYRALLTDVGLQITSIDPLANEFSVMQAVVPE